MTVPAATSRIDADEFLSRDFPIGSELVDGVVYMNDPAFLHQEVVSRLLQALAVWAVTTGRGRAGVGGNWVLADRHVYKPDVWWAAVPPRGTRNNGPPELAVEVRSPGTEEGADDLGPTAQRPGGALAALDVRPDTTAVSGRSSALREHHLDAARYGRSSSAPSWARDVGPKLRRYEAACTAELWLVDPSSAVVLVFRRDADGVFGTALEFGADDPELASPVLPGFTLDIRALFADLE